MTTESQPSGPDPEAIKTARSRIAVFPIAALGFVAGIAAGAYLNWFWWEIGYRPLVIILTLAIVVVGGVVSLIPRVVAGRIGMVVLAIGLGMLVGQLVGPAREPLIHQPGGTMTLRLESPLVAVVTGSVECDGVSSETEFLVQAAPDLPPGEASLPDTIVAQLGDRWSYPRDAGRADRVRLEIGVSTRLDAGSGKVESRVGMEAAQASILESRFGNDGGEIRFSNLVAHDGPGYTGEPMNLAGTFEWTCGTPIP